MHFLGQDFGWPAVSRQPRRQVSGSATINPRMPNVGRVLETSLYVEQLDRSIDFYQRIFGFEKLTGDDRFCAFNVSGQQVLLLFLNGSSLAPMPMPGGVIPPHDGSGHAASFAALHSSDRKDDPERTAARSVSLLLVSS